MNVLTLQGSPRKKGSTAKILGWVEEELQSLGHDITSIFLNAKSMKGCLACAKCKNKVDEIACIQKDDVPEILKGKRVIQLDLAAMVAGSRRRAFDDRLAGF